MFRIKKKTSSGALFATLRAAVQKTMIVNAMIIRIDVFSGYELKVEFAFDIRQFFEGLDLEVSA